MFHVIRRIHSLNGRNSIVNQLLLTKNVRTASSVPTKKVATKTEDLDEKFLKVFHYPHVIKVALYQRLKVIISKSFNFNRNVFMTVVLTQKKNTRVSTKRKKFQSKLKDDNFYRFTTA